jgi:glutathione S-transferase
MQRNMQVDMLLNEAYDMRSKMVYTSYTRKDLYDQKKAELDSLYLPKELELFAKYLGDKHWFVGRGKGVLTLVDFVLYELLDQVTCRYVICNRLTLSLQLIVMSPQCVKPFPVFMAYLQRFRNLDPIKRYMSSKKFIERPINNLSASFY